MARVGAVWQDELRTGSYGEARRGMARHDPVRWGQPGGVQGPNLYSPTSRSFPSSPFPPSPVQAYTGYMSSNPNHPPTTPALPRATGGRRPEPLPPPVDDRAMEALRLANTGLNYPEIGKRMGLSKQAARYLVKRAAGQRALQFEEEREYYFVRQVDRLEELLSGVYRIAAMGDLEAMDRALKVIGEQNKMLGLYAGSENSLHVSISPATAPYIAQAIDVAATQEALDREAPLPLPPATEHTPATPDPTTNGHSSQ